MRNIYIFIISFFCFISSIHLHGQEKKKLEPKENLLKNGIIVQFDIASVLNSAFISKDIYSLEGALSVDLKHKYFPVVEIGFAGANKYSNNDIHYKTNAPFGRIGVDVNLIKQKVGAKPTKNSFIAGLRLGASTYIYDISNVTITDEYWGGNETLNYNNVSATKVWYELVAGVKVEVVKNIYMGWTVRNKHIINKDTEGDISSWYIPGYGKNTSSVWTANYSIGYRF